MASVAVVGAGQSGLIAARMLAERRLATTLVERLPAPGGQEPEGAPERRLADAARAAGVAMRLGTFAVRWTGDELVTLGVEGATRLRVEALVVATGTRPATRAELGIAGDRCAGVLPATAAVHLIEAGVLPGYSPAVCGGGGLARRCAELLLESGAHQVTVISDHDPVVELPGEVRVLNDWRITSAHGVTRLAALWLARGEARERVAADALLLAAGRIPMQNIDGAVLISGLNESGRIVQCHSSAEPKVVDDAERTARQAVESVEAALNGQSAEERALRGTEEG
jgi:pyruvate/2-oxoglutarate dehydrogenase complex dihydrolipoamide dehydrogenase (E3) component